MTACAHKACPNEGTHHPVLLAMPKGRPEYEGKPLEMVLGILVCPDHQAGTTPEGFVTDEGWAQIVGATFLVNRAEPDRASLGLAWKLPAMVVGAFPPSRTNAIAGEQQLDDAVRPRRGVS